MAGKHLKKKDNLWILFNGKEYCVGLTNEAQEELETSRLPICQKQDNR